MRTPGPRIDSLERRAAEPPSSDERARAGRGGNWVLGLVAVVFLVFALVFEWLYLRSHAEPVPPEHVLPPSTLSSE